MQVSSGVVQAYRMNICIVCIAQSTFIRVLCIMAKMAYFRIKIAQKESILALKLPKMVYFRNKIAQKWRILALKTKKVIILTLKY
jgi:hypothetical protein